MTKSLSRPVRILALCLLGLIVLLVGLGAEAVLDGLEVVEKGKLLPYTDGRIYRVRLFDRWDVLVEPEQKPNKDILGAYVLVGTAFIALTYFVLLIRRESPPSDLRQRLAFFGTLFVGASYLAADEVFGIHESIGHNLPWLMSLPMIERPDDAIILAYALPVAGFCWYFRRYLLNSGQAKALFGGAAAAFAMAAICDIFGWPIEEYLEVVVAFLLTAGVLILGADLTAADSDVHDQTA